MWLVACQDGDADAGAVVTGLRERGLDPVERVTAAQLVHGARWEHRVATAGTRTRITLSDGRTVDSDDVRAVLNRLLWVTAEGFAGASEVDREYAGAELYALVQSWLASLGPRVVNRPAGTGLLGAWRRTDQWRWAARDAGLAVRPFPGEELAPFEGHRVLVVDGALAGGAEIPAAVRDGSCALARALALDLVELHFDDAWAFADASQLPVLASGCEARLDAVAAALRQRAR